MNGVIKCFKSFFNPGLSALDILLLVWGLGMLPSLGWMLDWPLGRAASLFTLPRCKTILWLWLFTLAFVSPVCASSQAPFFTPKYDGLIQEATHRWWPDFPFWRYWKAQLYQESQLDPAAISPVGAAGLAQFMPGTWADVERQLGFGQVDPHVAKYAVQGGAYYMAQLRKQWSAPRPAEDRQRLAQASYNAGTGNVLRAQAICRGAPAWLEIAPCLGRVTGATMARQTTTYVERIAQWFKMMGGIR